MAESCLGLRLLYSETALRVSLRSCTKLPFPSVVAILFTVFAGIVAAGAQGNDAPEVTARTHWSAQWISHPTAPLREAITLHFKKAIEIKAVPPHFVVHVSADNRFVLYLNGERVGDGPARGDLNHWRYETFDLGPMLRVGANTLAATVWNFGVYAPVAQFSDRTAFLVEGDTKAEAEANTNSSWMVEVEPGQVPLPRKPNGLDVYFASGPGERLRAADYDWKWMTGGGTGWVAAASAIRESIYPGFGVAASYGHQADLPWALVPDELAHMAYDAEDTGHVVRTGLSSAKSFPAQAATIPAHTTEHILLDRSELTTAYPKLTFSGGKGSHVTFTYAEALYDEKRHKGNRNEVGNRKALGIVDDIYPDGGEGRVFETLWWRTWRYLDIAVETADEPLVLDKLEAHYTAFPFKTLASFTSSDPELDKIFKIGWHTAQLDAHETYMDTPYYEQLQYSGDTRIQAMITYSMTGNDQLPRQAIQALNDSRIPLGITASRYPSALPQYIPPFSLLWIGMLHDNYMYRPDTKFVKDTLPGTRTVLDWFATYQHSDGLLSQLPWWSFIDWIETDQAFPSYDANGESCLTTFQYVGALQDAIEMEAALGDPVYVEMDKKRLAAAKSGLTAQCWDKQAGLFADSPKKDIFSQHANMLAVLYDLVPKDEQQALLRRVFAKDMGEVGASGGPQLIHASFYFRYYLARALDHAGIADDYVKTLGTWRDFLKMGFSTWPEQPGDTRSDSHAWSAHPTCDLLTLVAGIAPAEPGFKTVRITPHLGALTHLEATYPHPLGLIHVKYSVGGGVTHAEIELPEGLTGELVWKGKAMPLKNGKASFDLM
jgi:alpha-L-rhamnosidase